jgi:hypothetical protein
MHESLVSHWDPHWDHTGTTLGPYVDPIWDHVVDVFVGQLSVPLLVAQAVGSQKLHQHRQLRIYVGNLFETFLLAQTVGYSRVS